MKGPQNNPIKFYPSNGPKRLIKRRTIDIFSRKVSRYHSSICDAGPSDKAFYRGVK